MGVSLLGVSLLLVAVLIAWAVLAKGGVVLARRRAAPTRHPGRWLALRIVCAAAGVGLLAAVGLVTRSAAYGVYADRETSAHLRVHVPAEAVDAALAGAADLDEAEAKYLVHFIVAEFDAAGVAPLAVEEFQINWPADKRKFFKGTIECAGAVVETGFTVERIERVLPSEHPLHEREPWAETEAAFGGKATGMYGQTYPDTPESLSLHGSHSVSVQNPKRRSSRSGGGIGTPGGTILVASSRQKPLLLSATHKRMACIRVFYLITQAGLDDPLTTVSVDELLASHAPAVENLREQVEATRQEPDKLGLSGGVRLALWLGLTTAVLVVAVALLALALPMPKRSVAAIGATLIVVLFMVAVDRSMLAYHLDRMDDKTATVEERLLGCAQATDTFFFRKTALKHVEAVVKDGNAPPELLSLAEPVCISLGR